MSEFVTFPERLRWALSVISKETQSQVTLNAFLVTRCYFAFPNALTTGRSAGLPFVQVATRAAERIRRR
jgi:hypothetical protein